MVGFFPTTLPGWVGQSFVAPWDFHKIELVAQASVSTHFTLAISTDTTMDNIIDRVNVHVPAGASNQWVHGYTSVPRPAGTYYIRVSAISTTDASFRIVRADGTYANGVYMSSSVGGVPTQFPEYDLLFRVNKSSGIRTNTLEVSSDTFANGNAKDTNYGNNTILSYGTFSGTNYGIAYLHLPTPSLNAGEQVSRVRLYLTNYFTNRPAGTVDVSSPNTAWAEGTLTYNNQPARTLVSNVSVGAQAPSQQYIIDLTGLNIPRGIALQKVGTDLYQFYSAEWADPALRPKVEYTIASAPIIDSNVKIYKAGAWTNATVKKWTGTEWVNATITRY